MVDNATAGSGSELPPDLLRAVAAEGGGRLVLVLGAGCSHEAPTDLPLAGALARECHRSLVADGILGDRDVEQPNDLSAVAEAVFAATRSQRELVERFPPDRFRHAEPNEGYAIAAALLQEGVLSDVLTLNFDMAAVSALAQLGAGPAVSTIRGPEDHHRLGARNVIYLHRDINSDPDHLILRREALEEAWREGWEEVVAQRVLSGPVTVFIGLGSPVGVLIETATKILGALRDAGRSLYIVDPVDPADSGFLQALGLNVESYIRMGWTAFMVRLAHRLMEEHAAAFQSECARLTQELGLEAEDVQPLCARLIGLGLVGMGRLRASWFLTERSFMPHNDAEVRLLSDLLLIVAMIERLSGLQALLEDDGIIRFESESRTVELFVCTGGGVMHRAALEARLSQRRQRLRQRGRRPAAAIATGVVGPSVPIATPANITGDSHPADIAQGIADLHIFLAADLRANPDLVGEVVA